MIDLEFLGRLAIEAGEAILKVYSTSFEVEHKADHSPLTLADKESHRIIAAALRSRYPDIPVLSEEGREIPYEERALWERFWLVDPLDGTKEFVKRNGEFTVNIALIQDSRPVVGVILIPVDGALYVGKVGEGCRRILRDGKKEEIRVHERVPGSAIRVVGSRSHASSRLRTFIAALPENELLVRGSSLKFCALAAGEADLYPRFGPTWEWDTAAGHAIVTAAGGEVVGPRGEPFRYNKRELLNGPFLAASSIPWMQSNGILELASRIATD